MIAPTNRCYDAVVVAAAAGVAVAGVVADAAAVQDADVDGPVSFPFPRAAARSRSAAAEGRRAMKISPDRTLGAILQAGGTRLKSECMNS